MKHKQHKQLTTNKSNIGTVFPPFTYEIFVEFVKFI